MHPTGGIAYAGDVVIVRLTLREWRAPLRNVRSCHRPVRRASRSWGIDPAPIVLDQSVFRGTVDESVFAFATG